MIRDVRRIVWEHSRGKREKITMKTWEKVYWGIVLGFFAIIILGIALTPGDIEIKNRAFNKTTITYISKGKALAYFIPSWLGFFGLIWLIAKVASGGFSKRDN